MYVLKKVETKYLFYILFIGRKRRLIEDQNVCVYMHLVSKYFSKVDKSGKNMKISMILLVRLVL